MLRPDLKMVPLRGNVDTRLRKAQTEEYDAVVLAAAGVIRLGRAAEITEYLDLDLLLPDPGQAALAVQARTDDPALAKLVARLDDAPTRAAVTAERALLRALGGGCRMPLGAYADVREQMLHLRGLIASVDGTRAVRDEVTGPWDAPEELGARLAEKLLRAGGREVLRQSVLIGKRILITRAQEQSADFATKIKAYGGVPVEFPTIRFEPVKDPATLDNALARINEFEWVVFTSANGVRAAAQRQGAVAWLPRAAQSRIAAIGPATARELGQLGLHVDFVPSRYLGEQIAMELPARPGEKALLLRADLASDALAEGLRARGVQVTDVDAYRTLHEESAPVDWGHIDAVTFTSSSTVRNWVEMSGEHGRRVLSHASVFCIGPVTAESARSLGIRVDAVAQEHTVDGLVETIVNYYEGNRNDA
jgi:uroporphyrinogen-III synthase